MVLVVSGSGFLLWVWAGGCIWYSGPWGSVFGGGMARIACRILVSISSISFSMLSSSTAMKSIRSFLEALPLSSLSDRPVFSGVAPSSSLSWARLRKGGLRELVPVDLDWEVAPSE